MTPAAQFLHFPFMFGVAHKLLNRLAFLLHAGSPLTLAAAAGAARRRASASSRR